MSRPLFTAVSTVLALLAALTLAALLGGAADSPAGAEQAPAVASAGPSGAPILAAPPTCEAEQSLAKLDARLPVPLLPQMANHQKQNMRDHLLSVQEIVAAAASDDFAAVELAASRIGFSAEMGRMCEHMGARAAGFTEQALQFHRTADSIAVAARLHDSSAVLQALGRTLATCTTCHATYRQSVVDAAAWNAQPTAAAQGAPPGQ